MFKLNKKGDMVKMLWFLAMGLVVLLIAFLVINWFRGGGEKTYGIVDETIDSLGDYDDDGVRNMNDDCPCRVGSKELKGCPTGVTSEDAKEERKEYKEGKCDEFLASLPENYGPQES